jgi:purine-nucleoside phosphorylase
MSHASTANEDARKEAAAVLQALAAHGISGPFDLAMVLGTGLGPMAELLEEPIAVPYRELPGFPESHVTGHAHRLVAGTLEGQRVLIFQGRFHYYERGDAAAMRLPIATVAALGCPRLLLTNSCGSVQPEWLPGQIAILKDHINYAGVSPLIGEASDARFVSLTDAYDPALRASLRKAAGAAGVPVHDGVYMWFNGPMFETPAEIAMARILGADLVGMSTVPEVILARRFGLRVAALSMITNLAAGIAGSSPSHTETKEVATSGGAAMQELVRAFLKELGHG